MKCLGVILPWVTIGLCVLAAAAFKFWDHVRPGPSNDSWVYPLLAAIGGVAAAALVDHRYRRARVARDKTGRLHVEPALRALNSCDPGRFGDDELKRRKRVNRHLDRLAAAVELIPASLASSQPSVIADAMARGAWIRGLQSDVASLSDENQQSLRTQLKSLKANYDDGNWKNISCATVVGPQPISIVRRTVFGSMGALCLTLIILIIVVPRGIPPAAVSTISFLLGSLGLTFLSRAGLLTANVQQAVELTTKAEDTVKPGAPGQLESSIGDQDDLNVLPDITDGGDDGESES